MCLVYVCAELHGEIGEAARIHALRAELHETFAAFRREAENT